MMEDEHIVLYSLVGLFAALAFVAAWLIIAHLAGKG